MAADVARQIARVRARLDRLRAASAEPAIAASLQQAIDELTSVLTAIRVDRSMARDAAEAARNPARYGT